MIAMSSGAASRRCLDPADAGITHTEAAELRRG